MLTEYKEPYVPEKAMQEELVNLIFAPKLIVVNNRKLNWYETERVNQEIRIGEGLEA